MTVIEINKRLENLKILSSQSLASDSAKSHTVFRPKIVTACKLL